MRATILSLCLAMLLLRASAEAPREFAHRFYRTYLPLDLEICGVPTAQQRNHLSALLGSELLHLFSVADGQRNAFMRLHPIDPKHRERDLKPPWADGNFFAGNDQVTTFAIGRVTRIRGHVAVLAHLEYLLAHGRVSPFTDILILDRSGDGWVVADILFEDDPKTLRQHLREGIKRKEIESRNRQW